MITEVCFLRVGWCTGPEFVARRGGRWRMRKFPALVAVLRDSRHGVVLWDAGYSPSHRELFRKWPWCLQNAVLPVTLPEEEELPRQLAKLGIAPDDVATVILSHFHADHMGALANFQKARIICSRAGWQSVKGLGAIGASRRSYHPGLLPEGFPRLGDVFLACENAAGDAHFGFAWPLLDGAVTAVSLPGHAEGQLGLRFECAGTEYFFVSDALWLIDNARGSPPSWIGRRLMDSSRHYDETLARLCSFAAGNPRVRIVPSHCAETLASI